MYSQPLAEANDTDTPTSPNTRSWKTFADRINATWRRGAGDFIECGRILREANEELSRDAFNVMVKTKKLDFDSSVARKLMRIAAADVLCAHVHKLPPCWSTLYELSKVDNDRLNAAVADGTIHPGMQRKDAVALRPAKKTTTKSMAKTAPPSELNLAWWKTIPKDQREAFLDKLGRSGLCADMSDALLADFRDHVVGQTVAGASRSSLFAIYATDKLHVALRCAEQQESDDESVRIMMAALGCIAKKAAARGVTRSNLVIAEGKPKGRK